MLTNFKFVLIMFISVFFTACGSMNKGCAKMQGYAKICVDGIQYIVFDTNALWHLDETGKPVKCE